MSNMLLTIIHKAEFESLDRTKRITVEADETEKAEYCGHVPLGAVRVIFRGEHWIAPAGCFKELQ